MKKQSRILVWGDTHIPFMLKKYPEFLKQVYKEYNCNKVICLGDLFDSHAISRHDTHPEAMGSKEEYLKGIKEARILYKMFPKVSICIGNHDAILYRQNATLKIPQVMLKSLTELYQTPERWDWKFEHKIDGVLYKHGTGFGGKSPHVIANEKERCKIVIGHLHSVLAVQYYGTSRELTFGAIAGCGMDRHSYAAEYAKEVAKKPVVGCLVIIDGKVVIPINMDLGSKIKNI